MLRGYSLDAMPIINFMHFSFVYIAYIVESFGFFFFFFSSRRRHTRFDCDWSSDVCSSDLCGITGLRPTYGLVSRHGAMALSWTMDKLGPMARSAEDCALVLAAIAGRDALDRSAVARGFRAPGPEPKGHRRFRIGVPKGVIDAVQGEVAENFTLTLDVLRAVAEIVPDVELPDLPFGVVGGTIIAAEGLSAFDDLIDGNRLKDLTAPEDRTGGYGALAISARDYLRALRVRRLT